MSKVFVGGRIHTLRRSFGLTQAEMARRIGISTSYLNQIENNQRPITASVLLTVSQAFDLSPGYFSDNSQARIITDLRELFPSTAAEELEDIATRYPQFAESLLDTRSTRAQGNAYELVREYFYEKRQYIDPLDRAGEQLSQTIGMAPLRVTHLAQKLEKDAGITVNFRGRQDGLRRLYDPATRSLTLRSGMREAQLVFDMALHYALAVHDDLLHQLAQELPTEESQEVALLGLAQYFAAATTLPYGEILEQAKATRYDIDAIASHFGASFESTAHRLSTLQRPGKSGIPFTFMRTDRAGNITKRQTSTSFHLPRSTGTCPLWVLHRAFETPARITRQVASMPDGRAYLWIARYISSGSSGFGRAQREFVVALGCDLDSAHQLVYSNGLELTPEAATPIGPGCSACSRTNCPQRAFPEAGRRLDITLHRSDDMQYRTR